MLTARNGIECCEPGYSAVPRRLLVEPLLTDRGGFPIEYKFFMFNGLARLVMVRANYGDLPHQRIQSYYDMQWRQLPLRTLDMPNAKPILRPPELDTMRVMAERLVEDRDHIRVDFLVSADAGWLAQWRQAGDNEVPPSRREASAALHAASSRSSRAIFSNSRRVASWIK
jgi:hypothetical protein